MGGDDPTAVLGNAAHHEDDPEHRELVLPQAHCPRSELREHGLEGVGVDRRGKSIPFADRSDCQAGLLAPCVHREVVTQLLRQQHSRAERSRRRFVRGPQARRGGCGWTTWPDEVAGPRPLGSPPELPGLGHPGEVLEVAGELPDADLGRQEGKQRVEESGLAGQRWPRGNDERHIRIEEEPDERREIRVNRVGQDQLGDRERSIAIRTRATEPPSHPGPSHSASTGTVDLSLRSRTDGGYGRPAETVNGT